MRLVPNEWLLEWLRPDSQHLVTAVNFLEAVRRRGDSLCFRLGSPYFDKLYRYSKQFEATPLNPFRVLHHLLLNSTCALILQEGEIRPIPEDLRAICPAEDVYLAELAISVGECTLVTTDLKLRAKLDGYSVLKAELADEFLKEYLL